MGIFDYGPVENCSKEICMSPSRTLDPESPEILEMWIITFLVWAVLSIAAFLLVKFSRGNFRSWVISTPYYSGMIGIGTLWFSVFIGGFVIPDGQFGAWTHSLSQYTTVSVLVYYQPIRTLIPIGFSIANFGALVALAEGWRRWEKDDSRDFSQYKLIGLFTIVALSILMIPILDVVTTPSYLNALGAWGLTFLLIVIGLSASYSLFEAYRNGSGLGRLPSLFLLPMWGTLVIAGSFWVEASLSFARFFDRPIHLDASYTSFLFAALTPIFGSLTLHSIAMEKDSDTSFEKRLLMISGLIILLAVSYVICYEMKVYNSFFNGNYNESLIGFHEHILLSMEFFWLSYFGKVFIHYQRQSGDHPSSQSITSV